LVELVITSRNLEVNDSLRALVRPKIERLARYLEFVREGEVEIAHERTRTAGDRYVVQVTLHANGVIIRAEERAADIRSAVDAVTDKLQIQLTRYKERLQQRKGDGLRGVQGSTAPEATPESVVRVKRFTVKPMDVDEAVEQMELLGHDFFVFADASDGRINVLYRRADGQYGLLQPELG
jgi:putative sigma-54 modulation protein